MGTLCASIGSCLPPAFLAFQLRCTGLFQGLLQQGYSLWNHTEWSPTHLYYRFYITYPLVIENEVRLQRMQVWSIILFESISTSIKSVFYFISKISKSFLSKRNAILSGEHLVLSLSSQPQVMGISWDNWHRCHMTRIKRKSHHKKWKCELGCLSTNTNVGLHCIHIVHLRKGSKKYQALRLDVVNFFWKSECCRHKTKIADVI